MTRKHWGILISLVIIILIVGNILYLRYVVTPTFDSPPSKLDSIAVLPFTDMTSDKDQEHFCDGMAESIIERLAKVEGLKVIARTSSFQFKGSDYNVADIGKELDVDTILVGSISKSGNKVRISAQLIEIKEGKHLWAQQYESEVKDVFSFMEDLSSEITNTVTNTLSI